MKFSSLRIVTKDVPALAAFYENLTGASPGGPPEYRSDYVEFQTSGAILAICSQRSVDMQNAGATSPASNRSAILEFEVEDVDAERSRLGPVVKEWVLEPTTQPWGNRSMLFRDPDGNLINLFTPPKR